MSVQQFVLTHQVDVETFHISEKIDLLMAVEETSLIRIHSLGMWKYDHLIVLEILQKVKKTSASWWCNRKSQKISQFHEPLNVQLNPFNIF